MTGGGDDDTNLSNNTGLDSQENVPSNQALFASCRPLGGVGTWGIVSMVSGNAGFTMLLAHFSHMMSNTGTPSNSYKNNGGFYCGSGSTLTG